VITAFFAAILGAGGDISAKYVLAKMKLPLKQFLPFIFILLAIFSLCIAPFGFYLHQAAFTFINIFLFLLMITFAITSNVLLSKSMQTEPLHEYEMIILMSPLLTIILAEIFLPSERNVNIFLAGLIASLALIIARMRKHHLVLNKNMKQTSLAVLLLAGESILLKHLLDFYSPAFLYFIRVLLVAIVFIFVYRPDAKVLKFTSVLTWLAASAAFGTITMILKLFAFKNIGLVETTIIFLLMPIVTFSASYFYFDEHRNFKKDVVCASIVLLCIIYVTILKS
jgi:drug/metabolite transporter (DMT)-like permease